MKDDDKRKKFNNFRDEDFPDWTLTPADVDIEAMLEEARREMEKTDETLEEYIARTMGLTLDELIESAIAAPSVPRETIRMDEPDARDKDLSQTIAVDMNKTQEVSSIRDLSQTIAVPQDDRMSRTIAVPQDDRMSQTIAVPNTQQMSQTIAVPPADAEEVPEQEEGAPVEDGKPVSYGLANVDVSDTIAGASAEELSEELSEEIKSFNERINKRKKDNERRDLRNRLRLKIFLIALVTAVFLFIFSLSSFFTVDAIVVRGNKHFTSEEVINIAHATPGRNLIYHTGSQEIVEYLEQNPYIKDAVVTRKLPSTLVISITEREQACALKYDDDFLVLDEEGILLKKTRTMPKITLVKGLVVSKIKLGDTIGTKDKKLFKKTMELIRTAKSSDMYFVTVDMKPDKSEPDLVKAYIYDTFIVKGNYDLLISNLTNGRLHKVVEKLFKQKIRRGTITFTEEGTISFEPGL